MTRRAAFVWGALGGLASAAAIGAAAIVVFHVNEVLDHLIGTR